MSITDKYPILNLSLRRSMFARLRQALQPSSPASSPVHSSDSSLTTFVSALPPRSASSSTSSASSASSSPSVAATASPTSHTEPDGTIYSKKDWLSVIRHSSRDKTSHNEIKASLRAGVPRSLRARIWMWLADVKGSQSRYEKGIYERLASFVNPRWETEIMKDVHRTLVDQPFFRGVDSLGQTQLFRVLNAWCNFDSAGVGYAQSANLIVAVILLTLHDAVNFINPKKSFGKEIVTNADIEEWTFWILVFIMLERSHAKIYQENMVKRCQLLESIRSSMVQECPKVIQLLDDSEIELGLAFDQEFFSLLSYKCPLQLSQFALEMFIFDGHTALIDMMTRIMTITQQELLQKQEIDQIIIFLKHEKNQLAWEKAHKTPHLLVPFYCL